MAAESVRDSILSLITNQQDGFLYLCAIVKLFGENFRQILQCASSDNRLKILQIKNSESGKTLLHLTAAQAGAYLTNNLTH